MTEEPALVASALDKTRPADERVTAVERLAAIENPSYDLWRALCSTFNDETEDRSVRVAAVRAMGKRFPVAAPNQLCRYIAGDPDRRVRREAVTVLQEIGHVPEQMEPLLQRDLLALSRETKPHILLNLAMRYGRDQRALAALREVSRNRETDVRAIAFKLLGCLAR